LKQVVIVGCGVIGAAIAYELSRSPNLAITVIDPNLPASGSTGAALGVAMAVISQKAKGRNWRLREQSLRRYQTLLPELEASLSHPIQRNQGILSLVFDPEALPRWQSLQAIRQGQGYCLDLWTPEQILERCPFLEVSDAVVGVYSPQDLQVNPTELTQALVAAARQQGVAFQFGEAVMGFETVSAGVAPAQATCTEVHTATQTFPADRVILAAGLGSTPLTAALHQPTLLGPVLGQGLRLHLPKPLEHSEVPLVINGNDIHLVPLGGGDYWIGATVEFPANPDNPEAAIAEFLAQPPDPIHLDEVLQGAMAYCPALAQATITDRWFGLRPRPQGQAAPVLKPLEGYQNVMLATGHYRNGVLLAPATALAVRDWVFG
jgi:glycine/D-amino acid oxidase-like deaminating enzyme